MKPHRPRANHRLDSCPIALGGPRRPYSAASSSPWCVCVECGLGSRTAPSLIKGGGWRRSDRVCLKFFGKMVHRILLRCTETKNADSCDTVGMGHPALATELVG